MNFRKAKNIEFIEIAKLDRVAWLESFKGEFIPDGEHIWRLWVEYALTFVAIENKKIVGVSLAFLASDDTYAIHKLFVDKAYRGKGVGTELMKVLLEEIDILQVESFLTVYPKNQPAMALYEKLGFTDKKFVKNFYGKDEDRFILTRRNKTHKSKR